MDRYTSIGKIETLENVEKHEADITRLKDHLASRWAFLPLEVTQWNPNGLNGGLDIIIEGDLLYITITEANTSYFIDVKIPALSTSKGWASPFSGKSPEKVLDCALNEVMDTLGNGIENLMTLYYNLVKSGSS